MTATRLSQLDEEDEERTLLEEECMLRCDEAGSSSSLRRGEGEAWRMGGERGAKSVCIVGERAVVELGGEVWTLGEDWDKRLELETQDETDTEGERAGEE